MQVVAARPALALQARASDHPYPSIETRQEQRAVVSGPRQQASASVAAVPVSPAPAVGRVEVGTEPVPVPSSTAGSAASAPEGAAMVPFVRVQGNHLVNPEGQVVQLVGVDRSGTEYACVQGWGIFDGPSDMASVAAMAAWGINAVRIPLNEDCWLGINGVKAAYAGANYQQAIEAYVDELAAAHLEAILDLHWSAPGSELAKGQNLMADASHSVAFWSSVATAFAHQPNVMFDLYNEPHGISWSCWLDGCTIPASADQPSWQASGMQALVDAVRAAGATQPIMLGGLDWAGDLSGWLSHEPIDPLHQLVASFHVYSFSGCNTVSCWSSTVAPVAAKVPVVTGEVGQSSCDDTSFASRYFAWANSHGISYLAWTWDTWGCPYGLVTSYDGTPSVWGQALQADLRSLPARPEL